MLIRLARSVTTVLLLSVSQWSLVVVEANAGPSDPPLSEEMEQGDSRAAADRFDEASRLHLKAIALKNAQDYRAAEDAFRQALDVAPGRPATLVGLAQLYIDEGKAAEAHKMMSLASAEIESAQYFRKAPHHLVVGHVYLDLDDVDGARRHFAEAQRLADDVGNDSLAVRVVIAKAKLNSQNGEDDAAERLFGIAKTKLAGIEERQLKKPLEQEWLNEFADHNLTAGHYREAHRALLALAPLVEGDLGQRLDVASREGRALIGLKRFVEAESLLGLIADTYAGLLGPSHPDTLEARADLQRLLEMRR